MVLSPSLIRIAHIEPLVLQKEGGLYKGAVRFRLKMLLNYSTDAGATCCVKQEIGGEF